MTISTNSNTTKMWPDEILFYICSYLSPADLANFGVTCADIQRVSQDKNLWNSLFKKYFPTSSRDGRTCEMGLAQYREISLLQQKMVKGASYIFEEFPGPLVWSGIYVGENWLCNDRGGQTIETWNLKTGEKGPIFKNMSLDQFQVHNDKLYSISNNVMKVFDLKCQQTDKVVSPKLERSLSLPSGLLTSKMFLVVDKNNIIFVTKGNEIHALNLETQKNDSLINMQREIESMCLDGRTLYIAQKGRIISFDIQTKTPIHEQKFSQSVSVMQVYDGLLYMGNKFYEGDKAKNKTIAVLDAKTMKCLQTIKLDNNTIIDDRFFGVYQGSPYVTCVEQSLFVSVKKLDFGSGILPNQKENSQRAPLIKKIAKSFFSIFPSKK